MVVQIVQAVQWFDKSHHERFGLRFPKIAIAFEYQLGPGGVVHHSES
jgi:hypothetical protein